jgi:thiosulfate/3-mercaptopyruvate sulfurtransferase
MSSPISSLGFSASDGLHPLVSVDWLAQHGADPAIALIDCRFSLAQPDWGQQQYQAEHIPNAYYLDLNRDLSSPVGRHGGRHPLPDVATLAAKLSRCGIYSASTSPTGTPTLVIAYDDARFAFAARLWWLLRYLGHSQVAILDGGWTAWKAAGHPTSHVPTPPGSGQFVPQPQPQQVFTIDQVKTRKDLSTVALIDSREGERYRGEREPIDPVAGHIPGALNYPWQEVTDAQGLARSPAAQQQRWATLPPETDEIIVYCGSGVTACVNLLSLELAGISTGKLYAGSWSDWCSYL